MLRGGPDVRLPQEAQRAPGLDRLLNDRRARNLLFLEASQGPYFTSPSKNALFSGHFPCTIVWAALKRPAARTVEVRAGSVVCRERAVRSCSVAVSPLRRSAIVFALSALAHGAASTISSPPA